MKWLFFILVAINVAIFIWGQQRDSVPVSQVVRFTDPDIATIELLSDADLAELKRENEAVNLLQASSAIEPRIETSPVLNPIAETSVDISQKEITPLSDDSVPVTTVPIETSGSAEPYEANETQPDAEESIAEAPTLAMEPAGIQAATETGISQDEQFPEEETEAVAVVSCWVIGPIAEETEAQGLLGNLVSNGIQSGVRETLSRDITGYWVLLPPYEKVQSAIDAVARLKAQGIVDVQRFYKGEFERGVSLGVYNRRFNAEKRKAQIESKGFSPDVLPRYRRVTRYWVDYELADDTEIASEITKSLLPLVPERRTCTN